MHLLLKEVRCPNQTFNNWFFELGSGCRNNPKKGRQLQVEHKNVCKGCVLGKNAKRSFQAVTVGPKRILDLVHLDENKIGRNLK